MLVNLLKRIPPTFLLFLFFISIYFFTLSGVIQYGDEAEKYLVAQSIFERHDFSFRPTAMRNEVGTGGRSFSVYELGTSLLQVPLYALGRLLLNFFPSRDPNWITMLTVGLLNPILTALACVLFFKTILRLGYTSRTALALTLAFGLATITFPYARGYNREPILTVLLLVLFYTAVAFQQTHERQWLISNGIAAGALVFTKLIQAAVLPLFLAYIIAAIIQSPQPGRNRRKLVRELALAIGIFLAPIFVSLAVQGTYSYFRFGTVEGGLGGTRINPLEMIAVVIASGQPGVTSLRLLFSFEKSVFVYSPPVLLFLVGWWNWFSTKRKEALLILGLIVIAFLAAIPRPDGDTPSWWGPRYLVQVVPFFLLPVASLLESSSQSARRVWAGALAVLSTIGVAVQSIGVFTNSRDEYDITNVGPTLANQWEFLRHRALDSMFVYLSPAGFPVRINPFGVLLIVLLVLLGIWIALMFRRDALIAPGSLRHGLAALALILAVEAAGFTIWVVAPYSRVLASQANTKFVAANRFLSDRQVCKANRMYLLALNRETDFQKDAALRVNQALGFLDAGSLSPNDLMRDIESENGSQVEEGETITWTGDTTVKVSATLDTDTTVTAVSRSISVQPNTVYRLSGWTKLLNVYGTGYAAISIYEDDGSFAKSRTTDIASKYQTIGWQPFWGTITTKATTRRLIIRMGLWRTFGTIWIGDVHLNQLDSQPNTSPHTFPFCDLKE